MSVIRVVWGSATGPTATSAYDAALAEANVHNYNLVTVSSVLPAGPSLEVAGTAPDLGPAGNRLTVVQGRAGTRPGDPDRAVAGLGWARDESGRGIFYEAGGTDAGTVRETIRAGLREGQRLRDWSFVDSDLIVRDGTGDRETHTATVVCAVYGQSTPIVSEPGCL
jgi:arginine decarboxylase